MKLVDARKVISQLNKDNEDEELVYELEKYNVTIPKKKTRQLVKDKKLPNSINLYTTFHRPLKPGKAIIEAKIIKFGKHYINLIDEKIYKFYLKKY